MSIDSIALCLRDRHDMNSRVNSFARLIDIWRLDISSNDPRGPNEVARDPPLPTVLRATFFDGYI